MVERSPTAIRWSGPIAAMLKSEFLVPLSCLTQVSPVGGLQDSATLAHDPARLLVLHQRVVQRLVGPRSGRLPGAAAIAGEEDLAAVADHDRLVRRQRVHVVEA